MLGQPVREANKVFGHSTKGASLLPFRGNYAGYNAFLVYVQPCTVGVSYFDCSHVLAPTKILPAGGQPLKADIGSRAHKQQFGVPPKLPRSDYPTGSQHQNNLDHLSPAGVSLFSSFVGPKRNWHRGSFSSFVGAGRNPHTRFP